MIYRTIGVLVGLVAALVLGAGSALAGDNTPPVTTTASLGSLNSTVCPILNTTDHIADKTKVPVDTDCRPSLRISKTVDDNAPEIGSTITFTVLVANVGPVPAHVIVSDPLPAGLVFDSSMASQGTYDAFTGTWNVGLLALHQSATLTLRAVVVGSNPLQNCATAKAFDRDYAPLVELDLVGGKQYVRSCVTVYPQTPSPSPSPLPSSTPLPTPVPTPVATPPGSNSGGNLGGGSGISAIGLPITGRPFAGLGAV